MCCFKKKIDAKSMSRGRSFNKHITGDKDFIYKQLLTNFDYLYEEFTIKSYETKKVAIFFRDKDMITTFYEQKIPNYTFDRVVLLKEIKEIFQKYYDKNKLYRSTGVVFCTLKRRAFHQTTIFEILTNKQSFQTEKLLDTINTVNHRFHTHLI
jgi:hypothetical protein